MSANFVLTTKSCIHPEPKTLSLNDLDSANNATATLIVAPTAVVSSEPVTDSSEIPVTARVAVDEMTWGMRRSVSLSSVGCSQSHHLLCYTRKLSQGQSSSSGLLRRTYCPMPWH